MSTRHLHLLKFAFASLLCGALVSSAGAFKRTEEGQQAHDFELQTPAGETLELESLRGEKATVVVFWATWNPRSTQLLSDLQEVYAEHGPTSLQVVAVNSENAEWQPSTLEQIATTIEQTGAQFPVLVDKDLSVFNRYGVVAMPSAALVDGEGKVVELLQGYSSSARLDFRDSVLVALGVQEPEPVVEVAVKKEQLASPKARRMVQMGRLLMKKKQPSKAVAILEKAIAEDPTYAEAYRELARALELSGRQGDAEAALAKLAELEQPMETAAAPAGPAPVEAAAVSPGDPEPKPETAPVAR